ncbi:MAG: phosphate transporter, permease protein [Bacilli bacterium]|nr:phosphate transporter, permease protein [Bacilli bacterium]
MKTSQANVVTRRNRMMDRIATIVLWVIACFLVLLLLVLLGYIFINGLPHVSWSFLTSRPSSSVAGGGIGPEIFNSFYILFLSLLVSLPVGLGTAIWLSEYAKPGKLTDFVRLSVESLASVPSVVFGMFGLLLFVQLAHFSFSILSGSLALSLLNLPVLVRVFEESIQQVPRSYREASLALGANKWQTIWRIVLLSALPSLITGITLVAGRALGETAILVLTAGSSVSRHAPDFSLDVSGGTLSVQLYYMITSAIVPDAKQIAQGSAAVLVLIVLLFNLLIGIPAKILQKRLTGGQ